MHWNFNRGGFSQPTELDPDVLYSECRRCEGYGSVTITTIHRKILAVKPCGRCRGEGIVPHVC